VRGSSAAYCQMFRVYRLLSAPLISSRSADSCTAVQYSPGLVHVIHDAMIYMFFYSPLFDLWTLYISFLPRLFNIYCRILFKLKEKIKISFSESSLFHEEKGTKQIYIIWYSKYYSTVVCMKKVPNYSTYILGIRHWARVHITRKNTLNGISAVFS
jgi:hypothetical protein